MAIEIKELRIRVTVNEGAPDTVRPKNARLSVEQSQNLKAQIVAECTRKVLEKLKEKSER